MADEKTFSHIAVSADDEDDFVIEAGRRQEAPRPTVTERPAASVVAGKSALIPEDVSGESAVSQGTSPAEKIDSEGVEVSQKVGARKNGAYRQTQLDDLKSAPMSKMQKAVIAVAGLLIVGFVVYYCFLR